ncbi:5-carboxymethyl-2-hydroxymuconate Delta-isomerase [Ferrimonas balearica]|uniref:5-carboxymethyl-2-hydroxymuconate Delta-isomerase n=1 Tax=Ferrimonas balearica TaxID=44012 RepID=UPI001C98F642|nr:hypothetical protein [Ferrimonas balearica]MBY5992557.1 hypothetical protein [Ferrimonas balearica]
MPHLVLEYAETTLDDAAIAPVLTALHHSALASGQFSESAIKVRALAVPHALVAGQPAPFAHLTVKLLPGRSEETKAALLDRLLATLAAALPHQASTSVELVDLTYYRKPTPAN